MHTTEPPQKAGTKKITLRISYKAILALERIRLRVGGRITTVATTMLESAQSIDPENFHAALAALHEQGTRPQKSNAQLHARTR